MKHISPAEQDYITQGISENLRADGRSRTDYRNIILETNLIAQSSGSARCLIDKTDILVGIKVQAERISALNQEEQEDAEPEALTGKIICAVDCSPSASKYLDSRQECIKYSQYLNRLLNSPQSGLDLESLVIVPSSIVWAVYIDVLILNYDGNLLDAIMFATRAALINTRIPKCVVEAGEFEVGDEETEVIQGAHNVPISVTLCKIGSRFIVDASPLEDQSADVRIMVSVNPKGGVCSVQKDGTGYLEPVQLSEMIQTAQVIGKKKLAEMDVILAQEEERVDEMDDAVGFFLG